MYSITNYGAMIADRVRIRAYAEALRRVVTSDSVVLDLGTGTGIFALLACRFGARRVYAVEPADAIQVAREIAAANGFADRIEFRQAKSTEVTLPERTDVIVSDIGGVLPWFQTHLPSIADARRRFLAPGGTLIPRQDAVWAAVVDAPDLYARHTTPWDDCGFDFNMAPARRLAVNTFKKGEVTENRLLTPPQRWATIDYRMVDEWNVQAPVRWMVSRAGTGHGIVVGLDRILAEGIRLTNAPDESDVGRDSIYATVFFPWSAPVVLAIGDVVETEMRATLVGGDYVWCWTTSVVDGRRPSAVKARFAQTTLLEAPLSPATLRKSSAAYTPTLTENGRMARFVLDAMSQGMPLGEIATRLSNEFPTAAARDPLTYVAALAQQYG
ncbi:MAG TPA: class I SAM-dependent methyltransferase [Vicinamibacterales bacterium]|nr:class I SAM-dependent methyltransferase [Vicinamibacterales bacterium]